MFIMPYTLNDNSLDEDFYYSLSFSKVTKFKLRHVM